MKKELEKYAATAERLALLGAFDDLYASYDEICNLHSAMLDKYCVHKETGAPRFGLTIFDMKKLCKATYKKIINSYLEKHLNIYTDEYTKLHVNDAALDEKFLFFCDTIRKGGKLGFRYKSISLNDYIALVEIIVVRLIHQRKRREQIISSEEELLDRVNTRIKQLASIAWIERIVEGKSFAEHSLVPKLVVFKSLNNISCRQKGHNILPDIALVPMVTRKNKLIKMPVHRCDSCGKLFVGEETYKLFISEYGLLCAHFISENPTKPGFDKYADESKLHQHGYNVVDGELSERDRQNLLAFLFDNKIMTYFEICRDIENAISIFDGRPKYSLALEKWRRDLKYIGEYSTCH